MTSFAFHIIYKSSKAYKRLLHFLVSVKPGFFTGANIRYPAISEFFGGIV